MRRTKKLKFLHFFSKTRIQLPSIKRTKTLNSMPNNNKKVTFDLDKNEVRETYSGEEYDRHQIDSIILRRCYNRVSDHEWVQMLQALNEFKSKEMTVHKMSLKNTTIN